METAPNAEVYGAFTTRYLVLWTLSNIVWARVSLEQRLKQKARVKVLVTQSCPTLCDPMDCSLPGSSVLEILQARILEWIAIPFSRRSSWPRDLNHVSWDSCIGRWILYCLSNQYLIGIHARLGVGRCLPYTLCIMNPPKGIWQASLLPRPGKDSQALFCIIRTQPWTECTTGSSLSC